MSIWKSNRPVPAALPKAAQPQTDRSDRTDTLVRQIAGRASGLGREVADIAGVIEDTVNLGDSQAKVFEQLRDEVARMVEANGRIDEVARGGGQPSPSRAAAARARQCAAAARAGSA